MAAAPERTHTHTPTRYNALLKDVTHGDVSAIKRLFSEHGNADYVGEAVSQLEHALQAAKCARDALSHTHTHAGEAKDTDAIRRVEETIAAALLHDVGHMIGLAHPDKCEAMGMCGTVDHEGLGAAFCVCVGLPTRVCTLVHAHVQAKRYLCWKNPAYTAKLSDASRTTLMYQGGPMTDVEAAAFQEHPDFQTILQMRSWDEAAKIPGLAVPGLGEYLTMLHRLIVDNARVRP